MQEILKIGKQTFWQLLGKAVVSLTTLVVLAAVARTYGEAATGLFTFSIVYLVLFYIFSDFGLNAVVLPKLQDADKVQQIIEWRKLLGARLLLSGLFLLISLIILPLLPFTTPTLFQSVLYGSLAIIAYAVFVTTNLIFQRNLRYDLSTLASSVGALLALAVIVGMAFFKLPIPFLVFGHFLGWLVIALVALFFVKQFTKEIAPIFNHKHLIKLLMTSWPIALTLVLNIVYFRIDAFLLANFRPMAEVGVYNVAYQVFQSVLVLPTFVMNSFYPMMLVTLKNNTNKFADQIRIAALGLLALSLLILGATYYLAPAITKLITGSGFGGLVESIKILSFGFPAYFLSSLLMWVMISQKMYKKLLLVYSLGLLFNLNLNLIFIPQYSFIAASWITGVSEYLILGLQVIVLRCKK